ncbi:TonB-dependent siderophore receptor [Nostoc sp. FACHB-110]|uniref:TonB-dependent siderophore receptor n=1 Tax=Nostoc sp. FACHB-110 TaxID=2692834 RepID=UPI00168A0151|nr:TonB-dependent siderophore receptor [Nostoc sp. FACHB-110]MBD2438976.1 TonB-dependent siderophore receptor [Nostoc sp. FACHB-110]
MKRCCFLLQIFALSLLVGLSIQTKNAQAEQKTADTSLKQISEIPNLSEIKLPNTHAEILYQGQPAIDKTTVAQNPTTIQVTGVRLNPTKTGLEVVMATSTGERLIITTSSSNDNTLIADIPNAVLALPEGQDFQAQDPAVGIALVTITQLDNKTIRMSVTGTEGTPTAQVINSDRNLIFSLSAPAPSDIELVVTAEKTPANPQDVPISLTVLPRKEIEDAQINSIRGIAANTPNFFTTTSDRAFNFYSIRGLSNSNYLTRDTVGFYIDDVPYENAHQFLPGVLFDLERAEILKGPQSTLYGRNSQAGVVNIISRPPSEQPEFNVSFGYGNYNQYQAQLSLSNTIIPDKLGFRLSGAYNSRDGFTENTFLHESDNPQSSIGGRANIVWTPTPEWNISFNAIGAGNRDGNNTFVPLSQKDKFKTALNDRGATDLSINTQSLRVAYDGPALRFTSITSHNFTDFGYKADADYSADNLGRYNSQITSTIWSQELRIQSPVASDRFRWLVGGYYQYRDLILDPQSTIYTPLGAATFGLTEPGADNTSATYNQTTYAFFGQVDYQLIAPLTLTAGLRYESNREELDRRRVFQAASGEVPFGISYNNATVSDDVLLPKFALQYAFNENLSVYGSVTRGYKPPTQNYSTENPTLLVVRPEKSWNYEVGVKSSWLDNRLIANFAAFWNEVNDYQVSVIGDDGFTRDNANAEVEIKGVELEVKATPIDGLDIIAGFGYADGQFTKYTNPFTGQNFQGKRLTFAPEYTYNLALQYRSQGGIFTRVEWQGIGTYFFDEANTIKQSPFALFNTRLGYEGKNYGIYFYVNNIFDETYVTTAFRPPDALVSYGDRRTFGFQIRTSF